MASRDQKSEKEEKERVQASILQSQRIEDQERFKELRAQLPELQEEQLAAKRQLITVNKGLASAQVQIDNLNKEIKELKTSLHTMKKSDHSYQKDLKEYQKSFSSNPPHKLPDYAIQSTKILNEIEKIAKREKQLQSVSKEQKKMEGNIHKIKDDIHSSTKKIQEVKKELRIPEPVKEKDDKKRKHGHK
jgi:peptidoglycan hydrolase CwlO-like protein